MGKEHSAYAAVDPCVNAAHGGGWNACYPGRLAQVVGFYYLPSRRLLVTIRGEVNHLEVAPPCVGGEVGDKLAYAGGERYR